MSCHHNDISGVVLLWLHLTKYNNLSFVRFVGVARDTDKLIREQQHVVFLHLVFITTLLVLVPLRINITLSISSTS